MLVIAALHGFRVGASLPEKWKLIYYSYFSDFILPFGFYFLLCSKERSHPLLQNWGFKAGLIFASATTAECLQYFGIYALGVTFDPVDIVMYGLGATTAVFLDTFIFARLFSWWNVSPRAEAP